MADLSKTVANLNAAAVGDTFALGTFTWVEDASGVRSFVPVEASQSEQDVQLTELNAEIASTTPASFQAEFARIPDGRLTSAIVAAIQADLATRINDDTSPITAAVDLAAGTVTIGGGGQADSAIPLAADTTGQIERVIATNSPEFDPATNDLVTRFEMALTKLFEIQNSTEDAQAYRNVIQLDPGNSTINRPLEWKFPGQTGTAALIDNVELRGGLDTRIYLDGAFAANQPMLEIFGGYRCRFSRFELFGVTNLGDRPNTTVSGTIGIKYNAAYAYNQNGTRQHVIEAVAVEWCDIGRLAGSQFGEDITQLTSIGCRFANNLTAIKHVGANLVSADYQTQIGSNVGNSSGLHMVYTPPAYFSDSTSTNAATSDVVTDAWGTQLSLADLFANGYDNDAFRGRLLDDAGRPGTDGAFDQGTAHTIGGGPDSSFDTLAINLLENTTPSDQAFVRSEGAGIRINRLRCEGKYGNMLKMEQVTGGPVLNNERNNIVISKFDIVDSHYQSVVLAKNGLMQNVGPSITLENGAVPRDDISCLASDHPTRRFSLRGPINIKGQARLANPGNTLPLVQCDWVQSTATPGNATQVGEARELSSNLDEPGEPQELVSVERVPTFSPTFGTDGVVTLDGNGGFSLPRLVPDGTNTPTGVNFDNTEGGTLVHPAGQTIAASNVIEGVDRLNEATNFAFVFTIKTNDVSGDYAFAGIITRRTTAANDGWVVGLHGGNKLQFLNDNVQYVLDGDDTKTYYTPGETTTFAVVARGGKWLELWRDGVMLGYMKSATNALLTLSENANDDPLYIGADGFNAARNFNGDLGRLAIFDYAPSATDIIAMTSPAGAAAGNDESTIATSLGSYADDAARLAIPTSELSTGDTASQTNLLGLVFHYAGDGTTNTAGDWVPEKILTQNTATDAELVAMTATGEVPLGTIVFGSDQNRWFEYDTTPAPGWYEIAAPTAGATPNLSTVLTEGNTAALSIENTTPGGAFLVATQPDGTRVGLTLNNLGQIIPVDQ